MIKDVFGLFNNAALYAADFSCGLLTEHNNLSKKCVHQCRWYCRNSLLDFPPNGNFPGSKPYTTVPPYTEDIPSVTLPPKTIPLKEPTHKVTSLVHTSLSETLPRYWQQAGEPLEQPMTLDLQSGREIAGDADVDLNGVEYQTVASLDWEGGGRTIIDYPPSYFSRLTTRPQSTTLGSTRPEGSAMFEKLSDCMRAVDWQCSVPVHVAFEQRSGDQVHFRAKEIVGSARGWVSGRVAMPMYAADGAILSLVLILEEGNECEGSEDRLITVGLGGDAVNVRIPTGPLVSQKTVIAAYDPTTRALKIPLSHLLKALTAHDAVVSIRPHGACGGRVIEAYDIFQGIIKIPGALHEGNNKQPSQTAGVKSSIAITTILWGLLILYCV